MNQAERVAMWSILALLLTAVLVLAHHVTDLDERLDAAQREIISLSHELDEVSK